MKSRFQGDESEISFDDNWMPPWGADDEEKFDSTSLQEFLLKLKKEKGAN